MDEKRSRRRFLGFAARGATMAGALLGSLIPELRAHAAGSVGTTGTTALPPPGSAPPPLDTALQATLYSRALNDPGVTTLLGTLPEVARLDPPTLSAQVAFDPNVTTQQVIMPVTGLASGAVIAYLIYGSANGMTYNGLQVPVAVTTLMTNTGRAYFFVNGRVHDATSIDPMAALFSYFFPAEFAAQLSAGLAVKTSDRLDRKVMRKVMMDTNSELASCMRRAQRSLDTCLRNANAAWYAALAAIGIAVACIAFGLLVIGTVGPGAVSFAFYCLVAAGAAAVAVAVYKSDVAACQTIFEGAIQLCRRQYQKTA